jgi:hypothetical protein
MYRPIFGVVAVAAEFLLLCGCTCSEHRFFGRRSCPAVSECCSDGSAIASDGPIVGGCPGGTCGSPGPEMVGPLPLAPQPTSPQLAPAPRLVPQPQAQPAPFTP